MSHLSNALHPILNQIFVFRTTSLRVNVAAVFILRVTVLITITTAILILRRPDQAFHPALYSEEGPYVLLSYAECGVCALWQTVYGHILLLPQPFFLSCL